MSKGEEKIIQLLKQGGYRFEREKRFSDLKHGLYRFDFMIKRGRSFCLLEYNGEQHYQPISKFYNSRAEFKSAQGRDRRKISYCLANRIPLYIIPYWELDSIHSAADLFKDKYKARDRWKNDTDWKKFNSK